MTSLVTPEDLGYGAQRYNLVLAPIDPAVHFAAIDHAWQMHKFAQGYLLQERTGLPHITLCQFHVPTGCEKPDVLEEIFHAVAAKIKPLVRQALVFGADYVSQGKRDASPTPLNDHRGFWWMAQDVSGSALTEAQQGVAERLKHCTLTLSAPETYRPHLTFARVVEGAEKLIVNPLPSAIATGARAEFALALGRSSANGQLNDILYTVDDRVTHGPRHQTPVASVGNAWYFM